MTLPFSSKQAGVIRAATEVFLRYGFARTTMGDLAQAAGMSRPALYLAFSSKDEIFSAVVQTMSHELIAELRAALLTMATTSEKLLYACTNWGLRGYDLINQHPDSKDILNLTFPAVRDAYAEFQSLLVEVLAETGRTSVATSSLEEVARVVIFAIRGCTEVAQDSAAFASMIKTQVCLVVRAMELKG